MARTVTLAPAAWFVYFHLRSNRAYYGMASPPVKPKNLKIFDSVFYMQPTGVEVTIMVFAFALALLLLALTLSERARRRKRIPVSLIIRIGKPTQQGE